MKQKLLSLFAVSLAFAFGLDFANAAASVSPAPDESLEKNFAHPPDSARPWVYWFWNNGNVTKEGITADLEAMRRVGIGGVLIMDVVQKFAPPRGTATFMGDEWRGLFKFAVQEAARLGMEINMTSGPGWCGSSGPWITPELSMQKLVTSGTNAGGPQHFDAVLAKPVTKTAPIKRDDHDSTVVYEDYYRDIAVLAFPESENGDVERDKVIDLTAKMDADGHLAWDVPAGKWTIQRIGHTTTGSSTRPPVVGGNGLECDKLSAAAMDAHFAGMMKKLIADVGPLAGKSLVTTHIDSWEVGAQNWTAKFREEFRKRRGYDPVPFLPCITATATEKVNGKNVTRFLANIGGKPLADRFRWDFAQTISELLAENHTGHFAQLAHENGLRFSLEGYNLTFGDEALYTASADEPMTEFWTPQSGWGSRETWAKAQEMASVAHVFGKPIVGAEAFTSDDAEMWCDHPATIKWLGDYEFAQGVNRFVFHRYAHQPFLDRVPGVTMGPWGLHYERTQTWWEMSKPWHEYLARCQFMLRQGLFVADLLYLRPQIPNQSYFKPAPAPPIGYRYDEISAEAFHSRVSVKDSRLVLPDGMSYRALVLPPQTTMTPALLKKIGELVRDGASIIGARPIASPSLADYPQCDEDVKKIADEIWGKEERSDGKNKATDASPSSPRFFGKGRVFCGMPLETALQQLSQPPDFTADADLNWIHRRTADADIYFVANPSAVAREVGCSFRVSGKQPELWEPESGAIRALPEFLQTAGGRTIVPLRFEPMESFFVVFRNSAQPQTTTAKNFSELETVAEISGQWELSFPPKWGAPEKVNLPELISWSDSSDDGVKYFSGTATYLKGLKVEAEWIANGQPLYLDLGDVQVMAEVLLNGKSLGILWKKPFRVDIGTAAKGGKNTLEIKVVNLWPNRMIGDAALPEDQRHTWSTWEPFKKDSPLLPSGLLGPVTLCYPATPKP